MAAPDTLDTGPAVYRVENIYLRRLDGAETLQGLRRKVGLGGSLDRRDAARLLFSVLMRHGPATSPEDMAVEALELNEHVAGEELRKGLWAAISAFCRRFLEDEGAKQRLEVLAMRFPIAEKAVAQGMAEGFAKGEAAGVAKGRIEGKVEGLLLVLTTRFGDLPDAVGERVCHQTDLATLDTWLRLAGTATSLDAFLAAMEGD